MFESNCVHVYECSFQIQPLKFVHRGSEAQLRVGTNIISGIVLQRNVEKTMTACDLSLSHYHDYRHYN